MTVSLVGYTNAGKSTLLNTLTGADVLAENKLFATLDTRTRRWQLPELGPGAASDTVGFIRDLPHSLIASFKATLEEARQADLLLHVADASNPAVLDQIAAVYKVLEELGIEEKDTLLVLNKIDAAASRGITSIRSVGCAIRTPFRSAPATGRDCRQLAGRGERALSRQLPRCGCRDSVANGRLLAYLGGPRRSPLPALSGQPRGGPLPDVAENLGRIHEEATVIRPHSNGIAIQNGHPDVNGNGQASVIATKADA